MTSKAKHTAGCIELPSAVKVFAADGLSKNTRSTWRYFATRDDAERFTKNPRLVKYRPGQAWSATLARCSSQVEEG